MKSKKALTVFLVLILIVVLFVSIHVYLSSSSANGPLDVYVGIDAAYQNTADMKRRIDQVKDYTNFFVLGSMGINTNQTALNDMTDYLNASGLSFATFTHTVQGTNIMFNQSAWTAYAKQKYGSGFVGLYTYDEPGGHQIDHDTYYMVAPDADSYSDAAAKYVKNLNGYISEFIALNTTLMTSDYALYEYDYRAGYNLVLTEYAWNHSRPINTALGRGSAAMQDKIWGVMLTFTYNNPPYFETGPEMYSDLVAAYQNGAKYIIVFDTIFTNSSKYIHGVLQQEHLDALRQFWEYAKTHPRPSNPISERVAYVLPKDYGYGFRGPSDSLWGLWGPDSLSSQIWNDANKYSQQFGQKLDIIYEDTPNFNSWNYSKLIFWNGTVLTKT
jgi:hypothetical protein